MLLMSFLTMTMIISVGNSETSTEIPQPSTAGNDAAEVQFELTPCEAYAGPVNPQPSTVGEGASEVQFELTPCEAYARPVNPQPSTAGEGASEVQFELTPCEAYRPVTLSPHAR